MKASESIGYTRRRGLWVQVRVPRVPLIGGGYWKRVYLLRTGRKR
jgi:hypothetical protein